MTKRRATLRGIVTVAIDGKKIQDWKTFHRVFKEAMGFPGYYGMNMNAWIDCMRDLGGNTEMSRFQLTEDEMLLIHIFHAENLNKRLPEIMVALVDCTASVNEGTTAAGKKPKIALVLR